VIVVRVTDHQQRNAEMFGRLTEDLRELLLDWRVPFQLLVIARMGAVNEDRLVREKAEKRVAILLRTDVEQVDSCQA
jgi:hypothetical protein